ncbi:hypothetical protein FACS189454_00890 [Planctomycetales bacterium]|nr:hypothetical protein FACS189454_00890 [Planctomycetales bacterium]
MKKGILIAAMLLCCGLFHAASAAKTNDEVRETLDETFAGSIPQNVPLQTALILLGKTTGLDFRFKLPCSGTDQLVTLILPAQMTVKDALDYLAKQAGFTWEVNGGCVEITFTTKDDTEQHILKTYYIGDIRFLPMPLSPYSSPALPDAGIPTNALSDYIRTMVDPKSWKEEDCVAVNYEANQCLVIRQTIENHSLIAKLLSDIREKNRTQFGVVIGTVDCVDKSKVFKMKAVGLCGQEITLSLPESESDGERSLEISPCLTAVSDEQDRQNKPFQVQLPAGKTAIKVKGIAGKKNGSDVLKVTLTVDEKEPETRLFYGSLAQPEEQEEYIIRSYKTTTLFKNTAQLVDMIKTLVEPESWNNEAAAKIQIDGNCLHILHKEYVHAQITDLLGRLYQHASKQTNLIR